MRADYHSQQFPLSAPFEPHGVAIILRALFATVAVGRAGRALPGVPVGGGDVAAASGHAAGREGEDIDDRAYYPAALGMPNMLTVGAADGFGQPVRSNWGLRRVDVLAPAEKLVVRNFDDVEQAVSGAEFAAARVAALATRLLAAEPALTTAQLKARLLAMARLSDQGGRARSAYGVIPEEAFAR